MCRVTVQIVSNHAQAFSLLSSREKANLSARPPPIATLPLSVLPLNRPFCITRDGSIRRRLAIPFFVRNYRPFP